MDKTKCPVCGGIMEWMVLNLRWHCGNTNCGVNLSQNQLGLAAAAEQRVRAECAAEREKLLGLVREAEAECDWLYGAGSRLRVAVRMIFVATGKGIKNDIAKAVEAWDGQAKRVNESRKARAAAALKGGAE